MSKQSESKVAQAYQTELRNCGNCANRVFTVAVRGYYAGCNERAAAAGEKPRFSLEHYGSEGSSKCGVGGFAVKKTATCTLWLAKV